MNTRSLRALSTVAAVTLALSACGSDGGDGESAAGDLDLVADGALTVCSDVPYPPFEDFDQASESGFTGFDIDIVQAIADGLELDLVVKDSSFDALQSGLALNAGDCDLVASAMTINDERKENLAFSEGYYDSKQSLLVPVDSDITSIEDLGGTSVGVQASTTGQRFAEENAPEDAQLVALPGDAEMFQSIQAGQVDALLQDLPVNLEHTKDGEFTIVEEFSTDEQYGLAMKKDNTDLVEAVNAELQELRDSGAYDEIYNAYFTEEGADDSATTSGR